MGSRPITFLWLWPATDHEPHCPHVPINKIWRWTKSTPRSGWRRSHMAGIYSDCSAREIVMDNDIEWRPVVASVPRVGRTCQYSTTTPLGFRSNYIPGAVVIISSPGLRCRRRAYVLLLFLIYLFILTIFCQTNYLSIYQTDLHNICTVRLYIHQWIAGKFHRISVNGQTFNIVFIAHFYLKTERFPWFRKHWNHWQFQNFLMIGNVAGSACEIKLVTKNK